MIAVGLVSSLATVVIEAVRFMKFFLSFDNLYLAGWLEIFNTAFHIDELVLLSCKISLG